MIFDFTGSLHPGPQRGQDPQSAATVEVARAWLAVGDALRSAMSRHAPGVGASRAGAGHNS